MAAAWQDCRNVAGLERVRGDGDSGGDVGGGMTVRSLSRLDRQEESQPKLQTRIPDGSRQTSTPDSHSAGRIPL